MPRELAETTPQMIATRPMLALCPEERERMPRQVAHDLLGIVTIIRGFAELVPTASEKQVQEDYCRRIMRACGRMVDMVDRSLLQSRLASDRVVLKKKRVDLAAFLGDCLSAYAIEARHKDILLRLDLGAELPVVSIDTGCVERIVGNLLENAIKFSHRKTTVTLAARTVGNALEIDVEDHGQGIPQEELATLFEAYQTGSARPTDGEPSTGLGLSIVNELVRAHRGVVSVRSEVGRGSTFSVRLPLNGLPRPAMGSPTVPALRAGSSC